jgi:hypothetical protein
MVRGVDDAAYFDNPASSIAAVRGVLAWIEPIMPPRRQHAQRRGVPQLVDRAPRAVSRRATCQQP